VTSTEELFRDDLAASLWDHAKLAEQAACAVEGGEYERAVELMKRGTNYDYKRVITDGYGAWEELGREALNLIEEAKGEV